MSATGGQEPPADEPPANGLPADYNQVEFVDLGTLDIPDSPFEEGPAKRLEQTRALLAVLLFALLTAVVFSLLAFLWAERLAVDEFADMVALLVTPIVGLLGAATGYYYGRGDR